MKRERNCRRAGESLSPLRWRAFRWAAFTCVAANFGASSNILAQTDASALLGPTSSDEIERLVEALGNPSYETRTFATRRLCAIGPRASDLLRAASEGSDAEIALRAKQLLAVFDRLLFADFEVSLTFSAPQIVWSEPVDLILTMTNRSGQPSHVPFDLDPAVRAAGTPDARQVTDLLDVADWLKVRSPDGRALELRVDDLNGDASVLEAVQSRAESAFGGVVPPGEKVSITLRNFNRGWARYPLLDRGEYAVTLDYTPDWTDDVLRKVQAGRVTSNTATIAVTNGAPPTVSRGSDPCEIVVEKDAEGFAARFLNRNDQPVLINTNFGTAAPFAEGRWILESAGSRRELGGAVKPAATWKDYDAARIVEVGPGQSVELGRIADEEVRKAIHADADRQSESWTLGFSYSNLCDRTWQARQGAMLLGNKDAPPVLRDPLPRRLLATRLTSNRVPVPAGQ